MDKAGKVDFVWRYQPSKNTANGLLMSYVKHHAFLPPREMILQPLRAYWLALAYQEKGDIDPALLKRMFRKAVYALENHILYLCAQGEIDYPPNISEKVARVNHLFSSKELSHVEENADSDSGYRNGQTNELTTDELLELVGSDEFDDSGFA